MTWALVTGAAKRLGRIIALDLASRGYDVVVHYRSSVSEAQSVVNDCRACGVRCEMIQGDFSSQQSINDFIGRYLAQFRETKYVVNNVGNFITKSALQTSDDEWQEMMQSNLHAPFALIRALAPSLKQERGSIVNLGFAGAGNYLGKGNSVAYSIAKNALWTLTRALALELAPDGVRVNMVSPGHLENTVVKVPDIEALPMHRLGLLEEVARAVAFFIDDQNAYITGQNIDVAGGVRL